MDNEVLTYHENPLRDEYKKDIKSKPIFCKRKKDI